MKRIKRYKVGHRRPLEDVPFYKIKHGADDLPLDPFRTFITEEISKYQIYIKQESLLLICRALTTAFEY